MDNTEKYQMLADGETGTPSCMGIVPSSVSGELTAESIERSLIGNSDFRLNSFKIEEESFFANINYKTENFDLELCLSSMSKIDLNDFGFANQLTEDEFTSAQTQPHFLEVSMFFESDALASFHLQLKVLNAIVPDASLAMDFMSYRLLSARWLKMSAQSTIPPSPDYLYTVHGVYDEDGAQKTYWFHTHGLLRCRSVELEIMGVYDGAQQMNDLITMVVKKILQKPVKETEKFQIGYDGMGINLAWLRWEEALNDFPKNILGGMEDREGDDNVHACPSGILFAVEDNNLVSPQIYAKTLSENPIFYISNEETQRMSDLAKERFPYFEAAFGEYGVQPEKKSFLNKLFGKKEEVDPWRFMVKLGLNVDDAQAQTDKEHLWFDVIAIDGAYVEGKLLNQPYWIAALNEGDINKYPVELLTDWLIYSPDKAYTPDSVYQLGYGK